MKLDDSSMISTPPNMEPVMEYSLMLTTLSGVTFKVSLSVAKFDFKDLEDQVMTIWPRLLISKCLGAPLTEEIPCRDVHLARCLQFAMHKFRLSLFVKDLEPGGSTTFCFLIV